MTEPGVLFDLDGLLIDSEVLWSEADRVFLERRGLRPGPEIKSLVMGTTTLESAGAMKRLYGLDGRPEAIAAERLDLVAGLYRSSLEPRPGAEEVLRRFHDAGLPLALATASPDRLVAIALDSFGWRERFAAVANGDEVERGKPAPDLFLLAAGRLGVEPRRCVVVEDAPAGVEAARAAGMPSVAVPDPRYHLPEELPADLVLESLLDLDEPAVRRLIDGR